MNLVIDFGNSSVKVGVFDLLRLASRQQFASTNEFYSFLQQNKFDNVIISSVNKDDESLMARIQCSGKMITLSHDLPVPVAIQYTTPQTLGVDRIAAACGSLDIVPNNHRLVIDAGTCVNYEFVDDKDVYHGGAISPGVKMRFEAMHKLTARLPMASAVNEAQLTGTSTESSLRSGVINGIKYEINGFIESYKEIYPSVGVILCGGDAFLFENTLKHSIFVAPDLVLRGLNRILVHNVSF